jgi:hypothetical protein
MAGGIMNLVLRVRETTFSYWKPVQDIFSNLSIQKTYHWTVKFRIDLRYSCDLRLTEPSTSGSKFLDTWIYETFLGFVTRYLVPSIPPPK